MSMFDHELSEQFVEHFAGRVMLSLSRSVPNVSTTVRTAFIAQSPERMWTVALIAVRFYVEQLPTPQAMLVRAKLGDVDMGNVLLNLRMIEQHLVPFVKAAYEAQHVEQLDAAAQHFVQAVAQWGSLLVSALTGSAVVALEPHVRSRVPLPDETKAAYLEAIGRLPTPTETAHPRRKPASPTPEIVGGRRVPDREVPTPELQGAEVARAYLLTVGWTPEVIDQFLRGPKQE